MKEHGVTDEEAVTELEKPKNNAWKDLIKNSLDPLRAAT